MKKLLILFLFVAASTALSAQNVQLHYDMGKTRKYLTSTVESFKTDKYGSTFYFIDIDYGKAGDKGVEGPQLAYFEIARGIKFWNSPFELHVEYNGGFGQNKVQNSYSGYPINDAWLFGGNYTWNTKDYSKIFTLQGMYKNIRGKNDMSFQLTGVWNLQFFKNKITLSGFADFWREDNTFFLNAPLGTTTNYVFLTEPQFWYNVNKQFSIGGEIEMSSNFALNHGFMCNPTVAVKWNL